MGLQQVVQFFLPKEDKFYTLLEKQAKLSSDAAVALSALGKVNNAEVAKTVQHIEHLGDKLVGSVEEALAKSFVTPIDREDIHLLSTELDDVLDFCNQAARACVLFNIEQPTLAMSRMLNLLIGCTKHVSNVLPALRKHDFNAFRETKGAVKELEKEGDKVYRAEIADLFKQDISGKTFIAHKDVLDKLENAIDRCEDITKLLINLAVKHG